MSNWKQVAAHGRGRGAGGSRGGSGGGGSGGRGSGGGNHASHASNGYGENRVHTVEVKGYPSTRALFYSVLKQKVAGKFPTVNIQVQERAASPDRNNGSEMIRVVFTVRGPQAVCDNAAECLRAWRLIKYEFQVPEQIEHLHAKTETAPERIQCVVNPAGRRTGNFHVKTVTFPGDNSNVDQASLVGAARHLLNSSIATQAFRGDQPADMPSMHQVVIGRSGKGPDRSTARLNSVLYEHELRQADHMEQKDALKYLAHLVTTKAQNGADRDYLAWLGFLYHVEAAFVRAELAEYQLQGARLTLHGQIRDVARLKIQLESGIRPFTERRPSVMIDDNIILRMWDGNRQELFEVPVFFVLPDEVHLKIDELRDPEKESRRDQRFNKSRRVQYLRDEIRNGRMFDVIFDPKPYSTRCEMLSIAACKGSVALEFLQRRDPGLQLTQGLKERLAQQFNTPAGRGRGRGGANRSSRGGRFRDPTSEDALNGEEEPSMDPTDPWAHLQEQQRYAAQLINAPPADVRKVYIEGPCGTGKTETICYSVVQLLKNDKNARVLMLSPSHSASDVAAVRLLKLMGTVDKRTIIRLYPKGRHPLRCPEVVFPYTNFPDDRPFSEVTSDSRFDLDMALEEGFLTHRVVLCTLAHADRVMQTTRNTRPFTHIFVDECAQAAVAETLMGITRAVGSQDNAMFVFSGDEAQIGPRCFAGCAANWLKQTVVRFIRSTAINIHLEQSFRAERQLAKFQSALFYKGKLLALDGKEELSTSEWLGHFGHPHPVRWIHTDADPQRVKSSLINKQEIAIIANTILSLHGQLGIATDDMIVFTQHKEQRRALVSHLAILGCKDVRVCEVEEFHGDERGVVLISLVDTKNLDTTFDKKMLNTAIGRTVKQCIIVGNAETMKKEVKEETWHKLLEALTENHAVDGYDYDEEAFDAALWKPLPTKSLIDRIKSFEPGKQGKAYFENRFLRLTKEEVLENHLRYFVGVVSGTANWAERDSMLVRHRLITGIDCLLDDDTTTGQRKDFIFDGDLVAVEVDDRLTRWKDIGFTRGRTPSIMVAQPDLFTVLDADNQVTIEDFENCLPQILRESEGRAKMPSGTVVAVLCQPQLPPLVGHITQGWKAFTPAMQRFPTLPVKTIPPQLRSSIPEGALVVANLLRSKSTEPRYEVIGLAPNPFTLEQVLLNQSPGVELPNGAYTIDVNHDRPDVCFGFNHSSKGYRVEYDERSSQFYVMCYIPLACDFFARNPQLEQEAASRGSNLYQPEIPGVAGTRRIPLTSFDNERTFLRRFKTALRVRIPVPQPRPDEISLDQDTILHYTRIDPVSVEIQDCPEEDFGRLSQAAQCFSYERHCINPNEEYQGFADQNPVVVTNEIDNWVNYCTAILLVRTIPMQALLVRQDLSWIISGESTALERQEYWVPKSIPISRGFHSGTGFDVFAKITDPFLRYGDVLTQRLALLAVKMRCGRQAMLNELDLAKNVAKIALWLNTVPLVYGSDRQRQ